VAGFGRAAASCHVISNTWRSIVKGQKTPDLCGYAGPVKALCEVKTINISEIEADRRSSGGVGSSENQLPDGFFNKLALDLALAKTQMDAYDAGPVTRRIAYVIVNLRRNSPAAMTIPESVERAWERNGNNDGGTN
jgi:hypothetical protein